MPGPIPNAADAAQRVAAALEKRGTTYALGGAIALGYWSQPRGTIDVDVTLFLSPDKPSECIWCLQEIGCEVDSSAAHESLQEHGFCRVDFEGVRLDVFLPVTPFYEVAKDRRRRVILGDHEVWIWDAECLVVFKMMFFRRKDVADVEQVLQGASQTFDCDWVRLQLQQIYGPRDPRLAQWDELVSERA